MRTFSANVKTLLASEEVSLYYLVKVGNTGTTLRDTTAPFDIVFNGETYSTSGGLSGVEAPKLSDVVDREPYKITYVDSEMDMISQQITTSAGQLRSFESSWSGADVTVWVGFYNNFDYTFAGALPGQPITQPEDLVIAYKGYLDSQGYTITPNEGKLVVVLECASPVANLGFARGFYTSKESMRRRYPNDNSFDEVYVGATEAALAWGKK